MLMHMDYSANIVEMLGKSRVARMEVHLAAIRDCVALAPDRASWVKHLPISLSGYDPVTAQANLLTAFARAARIGSS